MHTLARADPCPQVLVCQMLDKWGVEGFEAFVKRQQVRLLRDVGSPCACVLCLFIYLFIYSSSVVVYLFICLFTCSSSVIVGEIGKQVVVV